MRKIIQIEKGKVPINIVVQPTILPNADFELEHWDINKASFHFYEELSRKIRGTSKRSNKLIN